MMTTVGSKSAESFVKTGENIFSICRRYGALRPADRVLDVGCGCGRIARPLTGFLEGGSYDGFDVIPGLVEWCQNNITPRHPNFRFAHVDVSNVFYRGQGGARAMQFRFPYDDGIFDFTILISVFTHMLHDDFVHYTREIARTLRPGGTVVATFFLLNEDSLRMKETPRSPLKFPYSYGRGVLVEDASRPEGAVAYPEARARSILSTAGLEVQQILFGSWCGRERAVSGQDVVIARKRRDGPLPVPTAGQRLKRMAQRVKRRLTR
jgi:SAM-dependent methyltransferase